MLQQINSRLVAINELAEEPYSTVLGYPACTADELQSRIKELESIGIEGIIFDGSMKLGKLNLLGKGCVGIAVKAVLHSRIVALKIRRLDADRESMEGEAFLLNIANGVNVGPRLFAKSKNFLAIGLADGMKIKDWIDGDLNAHQVRSLVRQILEQCFRLDIVGLDHGELSNLTKHIIVGENATIIDFESASIARRVSNVTASAQCLFIGSAIARKVKDVLGIDATGEIIQHLRKYKSDVREENFEELMSILKL